MTKYAKLSKADGSQLPGGAGPLGKRSRQLTCVGRPGLHPGLRAKAAFLDVAADRSFKKEERGGEISRRSTGRKPRLAAAECLSLLLVLQNP